MAARVRRHFLDRPAARVLAAAVCLGCVAALAWIERERIWPTRNVGDDPFARCFAERAAQIDRMRTDGLIQEAQAELFRTRAEAMCRAETQREGTGAPPVPRQ
jgi:hypothetical protein